MSFVPVGGKTLGIQIATSGKARLLRTLFGAILGLMRLNFLFFPDPLNNDIHPVQPAKMNVALPSRG
jgi:hypothetical protein